MSWYAVRDEVYGEVTRRRTELAAWRFARFLVQHTGRDCHVVRLADGRESAFKQLVRGFTPSAPKA